MTPILMGRWQTRIFLLGTLGALVTAIFYFADNQADIYWRVLFWVAAFGLGWDILYMGIQQLKWDRDWPPYAQWLAGAWEGLFIYLLIDNVGIDIGVSGLYIPEGSVPLDRFIADYALIFAVTWIAGQTVMRGLFPYWRFHGGRIV